MKSPVFVLIFSVLPFFMQVFAQHPEKIEVGQWHIGDEVYNVVFSKNYKTILIENTSKNVNPLLLPSVDPDLRLIPAEIHIDVKKERRIIFEVLTDKLPKLKENKEFIRVTYAFNARGNVILLDFAFANSTIMTLKDVAKIDQRLRKEIKATFSGESYKTQEYIFAGRRPVIYF